MVQSPLMCDIDGSKKLKMSARKQEVVITLPIIEISTPFQRLAHASPPAKHWCSRWNRIDISIFGKVASTSGLRWFSGSHPENRDDIDVAR